MVLPSPVPPTMTDTLTPTVTVSPSETPVPGPTASITLTPSMTITDTNTPIPTPTITNTFAPSIFDPLLTAAATTTILPQEFVIEPGQTPTGLMVTAILPPTLIPGQTAEPVVCDEPPPGGFGALFFSDPTIQQQLGCPLGSPPEAQSIPAAQQTFERGLMIWSGGPPPYIYPLYASGIYQRYEDTFNESFDPSVTGENPPPNLFEPARGFGKVWRTFPDVRATLGWATAAESGGSGFRLDFERGVMIAMPIRGDILVLIHNGTFTGGTWRSAPGTYP